MALKLEDLNCPKEKVYFVVAAVLAVVVWGVIVVTIFGAVIGVLVGILAWLANGLLVAHLRSSCLRVHEKQLPDLYDTFKEVCAEFNLPVPELFILQSDGMLNAFAMRHSGRDFVVLYSNLIVETYPETDLPHARPVAAPPGPGV
jgi:hypothetical protein